MKKQGVLLLGSNGMLGSMVKKVFELNGLEFDEMNHGDFDARDGIIPDSFFNYEWIVNCVGMIKQVIDESDPKSVWGTILVNAEFPYRLHETGAKVIQIATDCVYDGLRGRYTETDPSDALDVYGKTKSLGEVNADNFYNIRCSIIGPSDFSKVSLFEWFMGQPQKAQIKGYIDHMWNGVTTLHFAKLCLGIIQNKQEIPNLQHFVPADTVTKSQLLHKLASVWDRIDVKITDTKAAERIDRSLATNDPVMNNVYWLLAGYKEPLMIDQMLVELYEFMKEEEKTARL